jgi:hypothetical protein
MPATVTLSTTTLAANVGASDNQIKLASTAGVTPGTRLWVDRELMAVVSLGVDPWVNVSRGVDGTAGSPHNSAATVTIGQAYQFYSSDPVGRPNEAVPVSPYINVRNGTIWYAQGDAVPGDTATRWWQAVTTTYDTGPLGVRTTTMDPTSST